MKVDDLAKHAKNNGTQVEPENQAAKAPTEGCPEEGLPERYPFLIRAYGVLCIVAGGIQVVVTVLIVLLLINAGFDFSELETDTITSLIIQIVAIVVSFALACMFVVLGVRLLRGKRRHTALLANIMIAFEAVALLCQLMLTGVDSQLLPIIVNIVILVALQTYADPTLREERLLQHKLQQLEDRSQAEEGTLGRDTTGKGYIALNFYNIFWVFVICCFLGLIIEVIYHVVVVDPGHYEDRAGLLYGPFSPIYGFGAVLMTVALNRFHKSNFIVIFLVSAVIGGGFEYFVSWFMETAFGITAWDYTGTFLSINGRTNGMFMAMWGTLGLVWIKLLLPRMLELVNKIPWNWRYTVTSICTVLMIVDGGLTLASLDCWFERQAGIMDFEHTSAITQFCNEHYDDEFMENRFQSMSMDTESAARV